MIRKNGVRGETDRASVPTIWVIATDPGIRKLLAMAVQIEYACEVLTFTNQRSIVETAKQSKPALVIIHFHLLGLNAFALADRLHALDGLATVPTLLTHVPAAACNQRSHLIVLGMPFVLEELYAAVNNALTLPDERNGALSLQPDKTGHES